MSDVSSLMLQVNEFIIPLAIIFIGIPTIITAVIGGAVAFQNPRKGLTIYFTTIITSFLVLTVSFILLPNLLQALNFM